MKNGCRYNFVFECVECFVGVIVPMKVVFFSKLCERLSELREFVDEVTVVVSKT